ncbi:MAG TPA: hypothetical protein VGL86_17015, partial [Polyangia bacterium]
SGGAFAPFGQVAVSAARSDGHIVAMGSTAFNPNRGARAGGGGGGAFSGAGRTVFHGGFSGHTAVGMGGGVARSGSFGRAGGSSFGGG